MTSLPTWAVYLVALGTPVLAFIGGLIGQLISRRGAVELEMRSKREEAMRTLRWAAELAISADEPKAQLGVVQLRTLLRSKILGDEEKDFVQAALYPNLFTLTYQIEDMERLGEDVRVVVEDEDLALPVDERVDLPSEVEPENETEPEDEDGES